MLDLDGEPREVDAKTWARWMALDPMQRVLKKTQVGEAEVSTVLLGLDHNYIDKGPPILWETMIFGGEHDEDQWRYRSREEALEGHEAVVRALLSEVKVSETKQ